jgi:hypothetical protein
MIKMQDYDIQQIPMSQLHVNPKNPRLIKDAAFRHLVKSLADCPELFNARPCICSDRSGKNIILGGNMRYMAAKELKYKTVPAIIMSGLTEAQEREISIKDNGTFGEFDYDILSNEWSDLPLDEWGIKLPEILLNDPDEIPSDIVPEKDPNIIIRISFHPATWLGKREEIITITDKLKKTYDCEIKIEE